MLPLLKYLSYDRLIFVTDAAMNIAPDLQQKAQIIQNAVKVVQSVGVEYAKCCGINSS